MKIGLWLNGMNWIELECRHSVFFLFVSYISVCLKDFIIHTPSHKTKCANKKRVWALDSNCLSFNMGSTIY